jgi:peptide/nickel transport system substrate-binding protein
VWSARAFVPAQTTYAKAAKKASPCHPGREQVVKEPAPEYFALSSSKKAKGVCVCTSSLYGNAASRISQVIPSDGAYAYGGYPDIDALYKQQATETDKKKREAQLHQIQRLVYERVRYGPIFEYIWPSGVGPRVAEPALMLINPYPWSAPLEEVRLKKP